MLKDLFRYTQERSPLWLVALITFILYTAGIRQWDFSLGRYLIGLVSMMVYLILMRLSDDMCDIPIDRRNHPERLLVSGAIQLPSMKSLRWIAIALVLALHLIYPQALPLLLFTGLLYASFFAIKARLPLHLQLVTLDFYLFIFPVYAGLLLHQEIGALQILLGFFFWLGGLAHDYSHAVTDTREIPAARMIPINRVNQRFLGMVSLVLFAANAAVGFFLYRYGFVGVYFMAALAFNVAILLFLEFRLIAKPSENTAKPFYIFGFIYFLLPAAAGIAQKASVLLQ